MTTAKLTRKPGHDLVSGVVYGPVQSRRLGWSLGINWFAPLTKVCNFDCLYCQLGRTTRRPRKTDFVGVEAFEEAVKQKFRNLKNQAQPIDVITISGNGEPVLHPRLSELIDILIHYRNTFFPRAKLWILTNGSRIDQKSVADALNKLDERSIKLDGVGPWLERVDKPIYGFSIERLVEGLRRLIDYHLQVLFLKGPDNNACEEALEAWCQFVLENKLRPKSIQVYTVDRYPAYPDVYPLEPEELKKVVDFLQSRLPFPVTLYV